jgi:hypothetical protein
MARRSNSFQKFDNSPTCSTYKNTSCTPSAGFCFCYPVVCIKRSENSATGIMRAMIHTVVIQCIMV